MGVPLGMGIGMGMGIRMGMANRMPTGVANGRRACRVFVHRFAPAQLSLVRFGFWLPLTSSAAWIYCHFAPRLTHPTHHHHTTIPPYQHFWPAPASGRFSHGFVFGFAFACRLFATFTFCALAPAKLMPVVVVLYIRIGIYSTIC